MVFVNFTVNSYNIDIRIPQQKKGGLRSEGYCFLGPHHVDTISMSMYGKQLFINFAELCLNRLPTGFADRFFR